MCHPVLKRAHQRTFLAGWLRVSYKIVFMASKPAGTRVLVVDDDQQERLNLVEMVSSMGYLTETAQNGQEALDKIDLVPVDVILTDLMMPTMDGFELLRTLLNR